MPRGKTVFVTGGTGHIGIAICRACHRHGARVIFSYRRQRRIAEQLLAELPGSLAVELDLLDFQI
ncbi:MAG TPA: SDR family NAD(P)-dependent oxidoreductase [Accumulibacter sp.]|nr:SDR family NAD(P)-dependent oxidoreductase [Accumulibacter sp.]